MSDLWVLRTFSGMEDVKNYQKILTENGIQASIKDNPPGIDLSFLGSTAGHEYEMLVHPSDVHNANSIIEKYEETELIASENEHYLYQFTNKELIGILQKPDEWIGL